MSTGSPMTTVSQAWSQARTTRRARPTARPALLLLVAFAARHLPAPRAIRGGLLRLGGLGALVGAAWRWDLTAGLIALGVALLVLETLSDKAGTRR